MGIFLAYLLASALLVIAFRILHSLVSWDAAVSLVSALTYIGLATGLLYTVFRYVKRKW